MTSRQSRARDPAALPAASPGVAAVRDLTDQVGFQLRFANLAVWADLSATLEPFGVRPHHYAALLIVGREPGCKQQRVGDVLGLFKSNLVALIDELCGRGLVARAVKPDDRRAYALTLTPAGADLLETLQAAHAGHQARIRQRLTPQEEAMLLPILARLAGVGSG